MALQAPASNRLAGRRGFKMAFLGAIGSNNLNFNNANENLYQLIRLVDKFFTFAGLPVAAGGFSQTTHSLGNHQNFLGDSAPSTTPRCHAANTHRGREHILWERIHSRRGRCIRRIFIAWNIAFANEFAPTEFFYSVGCALFDEREFALASAKCSLCDDPAIAILALRKDTKDPECRSLPTPFAAR
jgi:hypothetical protein